MKLDLNTLIHLAAPTLNTLATMAIAALAASGARLAHHWANGKSHNNLDAMAKRWVLAAEQKFVDNAERQTWVMDQLKKALPKVPEEVLDAAMEAAVQGLTQEQQKASIAIPVVPADPSRN